MYTCAAATPDQVLIWGLQRVRLRRVVVILDKLCYSFHLLQDILLKFLTVYTVMNLEEIEE